MENRKPAERMPVTAGWVAELRQALGDEWVDRAMRASQQARREYARLEAAHGAAHAQAWLARQKWPHGRFHAAENGFEVGVP
jgi:hypothetical protein